MLVSLIPSGHKATPILMSFRFSQPLVTIRRRVSSTKLRLPMNRAEALLQVASASDPSILRRADLGLYRLLVSAGLLKDLVGPRSLLPGSTLK
jgi:hypothetical protein